MIDMIVSISHAPIAGNTSLEAFRLAEALLWLVFLLSSVPGQLVLSFEYMFAADVGAGIYM